MNLPADLKVGAKVGTAYKRTTVERKSYQSYVKGTQVFIFDDANGTSRVMRACSNTVDPTLT